MRQLLVTLGLLGVASLAARQESPAEAQLQLLLTQLSNENYTVRQEAKRRLLQLPEALPVLERALPFLDGQRKRDLAPILDALREKQIERDFDLLLRDGVDCFVDRVNTGLVTPGRELVDYMNAFVSVMRRRLPTDHWHTSIPARIPNPPQDLGLVTSRRNLAVDGMGASLFVGESLQCDAMWASVVFSRGALECKAGPYGCMILTTGDLRGSVHSQLMGCIVVCGGDVDVGRINGCLIIARGNVRATEGDVRGIIVSGGKVTGEEVLGYVHAKGGIDAKSTRSQDLENVLTAKHNEREREMAAFRPPQFKTPAVLTRTAASNPFPYVRFFELTQLGMETADGPDGAAISAIKVESVAERIGLQRGDCLLSVNGQPAKSQAELRELLRRALVRDGKAEIEYDRRGLKRATQLIHFLGKNASIPR